jgi:hypothetical protein
MTHSPLGLDPCEWVARAEGVGIAEPSALCADGDLTTCSVASVRASAGVRGKPGVQISGTAELQLLQRQGLDASGGGFPEGAAATVELAESDNGFAFLSAFRRSLPAEAGVAQVIGGEIDQGHDFFASEVGKPLPKKSENSLDQIGAWLQDLLGGLWDVGL